MSVKVAFICSIRYVSKRKCYHFDEEYMVISLNVLEHNPRNLCILAEKSLQIDSGKEVVSKNIGA